MKENEISVLCNSHIRDEKTLQLEIVKKDPTSKPTRRS